MLYLVLSRYWYRTFIHTYNATSPFNPHWEMDKTFSPCYSSSHITYVEAEAEGFLRFRFHRKRTASTTSASTTLWKNITYNNSVLPELTNFLNPPAATAAVLSMNIRRRRIRAKNLVSLNWHTRVCPSLVRGSITSTNDSLTAIKRHAAFMLWRGNTTFALRHRINSKKTGS